MHPLFLHMHSISRYQYPCGVIGILVPPLVMLPTIVHLSAADPCIVHFTNVNKHMKTCIQATDSFNFRAF